MKDPRCVSHAFSLISLALFPLSRPLPLYARFLSSSDRLHAVNDRKREIDKGSGYERVRDTPYTLPLTPSLSLSLTFSLRRGLVRERERGGEGERLRKRE